MGCCDDKEFYRRVRIYNRTDVAAIKNRTVLAHHEVGEAASKVAVMPSVRHALVEAQRRFADQGAGAVLDGRDIGTV
ncbi:MAG: (d)CMP kinase, partial [Pseudomonadota bacterium]